MRTSMQGLNIDQHGPKSLSTLLVYSNCFLPIEQAVACYAGGGLFWNSLMASETIHSLATMVRHLRLSQACPLANGKQLQALGQLTCLQSLDLSFNYDSSDTCSFADQISNLQQLQQLSISVWDVDAPPCIQLPVSISTMGSLRSLDLQGCKHEGDCFFMPCALTGLTYLGIGSCSLSLPRSLAGMSQLHTLKWDHITNCGSIRVLGDLTNLQVLELHWCGIEAEQALHNALCCLKRLQHVYIEDIYIRTDVQGYQCRCSRINVEAFNGCSQLETLHLAEVLIRTVPVLRGLPRLRELHLCSCWSATDRLQMPPNSALASLTALQSLTLVSYHQDFQLTESLIELCLHLTHLTSLSLHAQESYHEWDYGSACCISDLQAAVQSGQVGLKILEIEPYSF